MILLTGFGAFDRVRDNPSEHAVRALDGRHLAGQTVVTRILPVAYRRGPAEAIAAAQAVSAEWVVGLGVAVGRPGVSVETRAVNASGRPDVDNWAPETLEAGGPAEVRATLSVACLARALGAELSTDAGTYVCKAWLYQVTRALPEAAVGFVHIPPEGLDPERLAAGLTALVRARRASTAPG